MRWTDVYDIVYALEDTHPNADILSLSFPTLWQWVQDLPDFDDKPEASNEKILEAIQMAWLKERD